MFQTLATTDPSTGIFNYLFTQGVLGVVCVGLIIVVVYLVKKQDRKDAEHVAEVKALNQLIFTENKAHAADYKEMSNDYREVVQGNSQNMALFGAKIEVAKGKR